MATTQYIGSRYVPIFADPLEWSSAKTYEPLTIVTHEGSSYTSKQFVPQGIDITNEDYWALTGNYNAQVEQYRRETQQAVVQINDWYDDAVTEYADKYGAKPFTFDNATAMQNARDLLYIGAICHTNGFHTSGDGGAAWYVISGTGDANNMDVLSCGNMFAHLVIVDSSVTPEMLGAWSNGTNDDTASINRAAQLANIINMLPKEYKVNALESIYFNDVIVNGNNATISIFNTNSANYTIIHAENCKIYNLNVIGDSLENTATGEWGMGISIENPNVTIQNCNISRCFGDGVYITENAENINIHSCNIGYCRRQGISVIKAKNLFIDSCHIHDIDGTSPQQSIDFEGNHDDDCYINCHVTNCELQNSHGSVLIVNHVGENNTIYVDNCNVSRIRVVSPKNNGSKFYFNNCNIYKLANFSGVEISNNNASVYMYFNDLSIYAPNDNSTVVNAGCALGASSTNLSGDDKNVQNVIFNGLALFGQFTCVTNYYANARYAASCQIFNLKMDHVISQSANYDELIGHVSFDNSKSGIISVAEQGNVPKYVNSFIIPAEMWSAGHNIYINQLGGSGLLIMDNQTAYIGTIKGTGIRAGWTFIDKEGNINQDLRIAANTKKIFALNDVAKTIMEI